MKNICVILSATAFAVLQPVHAENLKVDKDKSRIQVDAKATGHAFTGTLEDYSVEVSGDPARNTPTSFELKWAFNDLKTADAKRDQEMVRWLGGGRPEGSFRFLRSWTDGGKTYAEGLLTIHGVGKKISFPYTVARDGNWVTIDGTARMDYQDFKLPVIRAMAVMTVDPKLVVRFHVTGQIQP